MSKTLETGDLAISFGPKKLYVSVCEFSDLENYRFFRLGGFNTDRKSVHPKKMFYAHYQWSEEDHCWIYK